MAFRRLPLLALAWVACTPPLAAQTQSRPARPSVSASAKAGLNKAGLNKAGLNKALGQAVLHGDAAKVERLLHQGASPHALVSYAPSTMGVAIDASALAVAVKAGQTRIVQLLLEKGASVGGEDDIMPPLLLAVHLRHTGVVRLLLDHGADPNAPGMMGLTPLMDASGSGDTEIVRLLLAKKANVSARDGEGLTALKMAADSGRGDAAALLKAAGAKK